MSEEVFKKVVQILNEQPLDIRQLCRSMALKIDELYKKLKEQEIKYKKRIKELESYRNEILTIDAMQLSQKIKLLLLLEKGDVITLKSLAEKIGWSEVTQRKYLQIFNKEGLIIYNPSSMPIITEHGKQFVNLFKTIRSLIEEFFNKKNEELGIDQHDY